MHTLYIKTIKLETNMSQNTQNRRTFLKSAAIGSAAMGVGVAGVTDIAQAQTPKNTPATATMNINPGYLFFNLDEQSFIEAVVDHMIPADDLSPSGTQLGVNIYIDRSLASGWGKGERLYLKGPWKKGLPFQGYQLPLTPAELYRVGISNSNMHCQKTYAKPFDKLPENSKQEFLIALQGGKITFPSDLPSRTFFAMLYQNVMEGMFADPIYGGNRNKAGWKLLGFPGVIAVHAQNVEKFLDKKYTSPVSSISDMS
jgi:gluconate 2-dehydrogenase gamma chain